MQRMGHSVTVVTYEPLSNLDGFKRLSGSITCKTYPYETVPVVALRHTYQADAAEIFDQQIWTAAEKLGMECDLVHMFHPMWLSSFAESYIKRSIPTVLTLTDSWLLCSSVLVDRFWKLCNGPEIGRGCETCNLGTRMKARLGEAKKLYGMMDEITTSSNFLIELFRSNGWSKETHLIRHSIDYRYVQKTPGADKADVTFGYIGTIGWHKGVHVLVKAMRELEDRNARLALYGSTTDNAEYFRMLVDLASEDRRLQFLGLFEIDRVSEILKGFSALIVPSTYYENYPLVILLALANGVPVIASAIGGMTELISNGVNGFTFEPGNYHQLAAIMGEITRNPSILDQLKANIVSPKRTEEEALDYENLYKGLVR